MDEHYEEYWSNGIGPMPEPCTIDRLMDNCVERWKSSLVACVRSLRKDMIHWIMNTGTCRRYIVYVQELLMTCILLLLPDVF